jgi:hypothetical protein
LVYVVPSEISVAINDPSLPWSPEVVNGTEIFLRADSEMDDVELDLRWNPPFQSKACKPSSLENSKIEKL